MSTAGTTFDQPPLDAKAVARDEARELLGQVMGYVAVTVGFAALGAYLGRDLSGATGLVLFIAAFACIIGLNRREGPRATCDRAAVRAWAAARPGGRPAHRRLRQRRPVRLVAGGGSHRRVRCRLRGLRLRHSGETSPRGRARCSRALLGLIGFGIVTIFVSIPNGNIIYAVAGLGIFGAFTIFDFNRLRRASADSAVAIAASIFLDVRRRQRVIRRLACP